jgi:hypothetical protein
MKLLEGDLWARDLLEGRECRSRRCKLKTNAVALECRQAQRAEYRTYVQVHVGLEEAGLSLVGA